MVVYLCACVFVDSYVCMCVFTYVCLLACLLVCLFVCVFVRLRVGVLVAQPQCREHFHVFVDGSCKNRLFSVAAAAAVVADMDCFGDGSALHLGWSRAVLELRFWV